MKTCQLAAIAAALSLALCNASHAQPGPGPGPGGESNVFYNAPDLGANNAGWTFAFDASFLKYHQSGGVRDSRDHDLGDPESAEFGFDFTPRFTVGYEMGGGVGFRGSYWRFDQSQGTLDGTSFVDISASTFDLEIYRNVTVLPGTNIEVFGGFRYADFGQSDGQGLDYRFSGWGGTVGIQGTQSICGCGEIYARARWSIVMGDGDVRNNGGLDDPIGTFVDHQSTQTELALGWQSCCRWGRCSLLYGIGAEWHTWSDMALAGDESDEANLYDAGWAGFVFRVGMKF